MHSSVVLGGVFCLHIRSGVVLVGSAVSKDKTQVVYALEQRRNSLSSKGWVLLGIFRTRKLALRHLIQWIGNDEGYDHMISEYEL